MEPYIVSARKYRPAVFDDVVGQGNLTNTLKNAIRSGQLAHAYLFCGPRGVGKTTCARIFAKTINCGNLTEETEACNQCESCEAFNQSRSYNIHELDAASNNTVEDIRNLIDQVRIPPQVGKYSVYIIDEVHMLSPQAFNAFLKTLEEPPAHAIFILATTEKHKILPTILSRCQVYDFNRIGLGDTVARLKYVAEKEQIEAEDDALHLIALKADGAMRDALSIFDQMVSFSGKNISYQKVLENLNVLDFEYYFRMVEASLEENHSKALLLFDEILKNGFDGHQFLAGLARHYRDLLVCKDKVTVELLEVGSSLKTRYLKQSETCSLRYLYDTLDLLSKVDAVYNSSQDPRLLVEIALMKMCRSAETDKKKNKLNPVDKSPEATGEKYPLTADSATSAETESRTEACLPRGESLPSPLKPEEAAAPDSQPAKPKPRPSAPPASKTFSIKNALNGQKTEVDSTQSEKTAEEEKTAAETTGGEVCDTTDQQTIDTYWQKYAEILKTSSPRMYTAMTSVEPALQEANTIRVCMHNHAQKEDFDHMVKNEVLQYLRRMTRCRELELITEVKKEEQETSKLYTSTDKYAFLEKKNPKLKDLRKRFNLDIE